MFNIGLGELIVILAVAFVFVGPSDLPKVARKVAQLYKKARGLWSEVLSAINMDTEVEEIKTVKSEMEKTIKEVNPVETVKKEIGDVTKSIEDTKKTAENWSKVGRT